MPRDYTPDDGGYAGPMTVANIFADGIRQTIEDRKAAERQNLAVLQNTQDNDLRVRELAQRKELAEMELTQRREIQGSELGLRREELNNRMASNSAELALKREQLAAETMRLEASMLGTRTQRAKAEAMLNNTRMAAGLLGVPPAEGAAAADYGAAYRDADVNDSGSAALRELDASVAAGMSGGPMPGEPAATTRGVPWGEADLPGDPGQPIDPGSLLSPPAAGSEGVSGPAGTAAPAPALPVPLPAAPEEDADYRLKLRKVLAMQKLAKDPHTPIDYQIKLEEEAKRIQDDPAFAMQVKNHAAKIKLAEERQNLPTTIFASPVDKQRAFSATYPHLKFSITAPGEEIPQLLRPDGSPVPDAEFRVIKSAWDQFEYKPGMAIPKPGGGVTPFGPPVMPSTAMAPAAPAGPVRPSLDELAKTGIAKINPALAPVAPPEVMQEWTALKNTAGEIIGAAPEDRVAIAAAIYKNGATAVLTRDKAARLNQEFTARKRPGGTGGFTETYVSPDEAARNWAADVLRQAGFTDGDLKGGGGAQLQPGDEEKLQSLTIKP
jgi:hypothetical protein